ncbi:MAG: nucleotide sugar dehydrogenase [Candidatus Limnocylindria bacterium]
MKITVIGAGYVGLVSGVSLAATGEHQVTFVERDVRRLSELRAGQMPIEEPGLAAAFAEHRERIGVTEALDQAENTELVFVAVGTPVGETGDSDLTQIHSVLRELSDHSELHVSVRSTLPPGFSQRMPDLLGRRDGARLSTNPEFLRQGSAMEDFRHPSRIVIGRYESTSPEHLELMERVYASIEAPRISVDVAAAELIKNAANGFLALKLSFVNEVAALSEEYGVEVDEVLAGIALDPRIGSAYMRPGLGFGGSCLPKELQVLDAAGRRQGLAMHIARAASQVNLEQQDRFAHRITDELPDHARVGLLGLSFKADTDDLRGSPAIHVARRLVEAGHTVVAYDPAVRATMARATVPAIEIATDALDVFRDADAVVIATEWPQFADIDLDAAAGLMRHRRLFDGRGLIKPEAALAAGFAYRGVGRRSLNPVEAATLPS